MARDEIERDWSEDVAGGRRCCCGGGGSCHGWWMCVAERVYWLVWVCIMSAAFRKSSRYGEYAA